MPAQAVVCGEVKNSSGPFLRIPTFSNDILFAIGSERPFGQRPLKVPPPHSLAHVNVVNLTKNYGPITAVRELSFELFPGEIFGLLGQNGAGKTTTIECLLGLNTPDAGQITISGIDILTQPTQSRQTVGALLQSSALQDKITPLEALKLFASFYSKPANTAQLLAQFQLTNKAHAPFASLSGGQKQRLFLALALVNNPQILILDEPTAGLDPQARHELHRIIADFKTTGRSVLLSTHNLDEATTLCDRIGILHHGRLIASAPPAELIAKARALPRVSFRTSKPLATAIIATLPGVMNYAPYQSGWQACTSDVNKTISGLTHLLEATNNEMLDLHILRPTLEDVFIELTGRAWAENPTEEKP